MSLDTIPDITMRGQDDPHGLATATAPTVGQLAARIHRLAGRPDQWWHLVSPHPGQPDQVVLEDDGVRIWLTTWPPGHRTDVHDHGGTHVSTVIAGELIEIVIGADGVTERPLRANRIRVHGGRAHEITNPGPAYAVTLHAQLG